MSDICGRMKFVRDRVDFIRESDVRERVNERCVWESEVREGE